MTPHRLCSVRGWRPCFGEKNIQTVITYLCRIVWMRVLRSECAPIDLHEHVLGLMLGTVSPSAEDEAIETHFGPMVRRLIKEGSLNLVVDEDLAIPLAQWVWEGSSPAHHRIMAEEFASSHEAALRIRSSAFGACGVQ